jgi:replicative DNA helicase
MNDASRPEAAHAHRSGDVIATAGQVLSTKMANRTDERAAEPWPSLLAPPLPPFPVDALPGPMAAWVEAVAEHTQTPPDLAAVAGLGVLSSAALGRAYVDCGAWQEELGLYLLPVLPSGERKSTVVRMATEPLRAIERERRNAARPGVNKLRARRTALESRSRKLTQQAGDADTREERVSAEAELAQITAQLEASDVPVSPRIFVDDVTPEKLGSLLAEHGQLSVISAESAFVDTLVGGRYNNGKANLHLLCSAYSGEPTTIDRKSHETEYLDRPLLAVTLVVQPHVLAALLANPTALGQGLVARFAYALPETLLGRRRVEAVTTPAHVSAGWAELLRRVATTADNADDDRSMPGTVGVVSSTGPRRLSLSQGAKSRLTELRGRLEPRLAPSGDLVLVASWATRHDGRVARIAGLLHLALYGTGPAIADDSMANAVRIGDYFLKHGIAAFTAPDSTARRAIRWLEKGHVDTVTLRELQRGPLGGRRTSAEAATLVANLERLNAVREVPNNHSTSRTFAVHPDLCGERDPALAPKPRGGDSEPAGVTRTDLVGDHSVSIPSRSLAGVSSPNDLIETRSRRSDGASDDLALSTDGGGQLVQKPSVRLDGQR